MAGETIPSRSELLDRLAKGPIVEPRGLLSARLEAMEADGLVVHGWVVEGKLGYRLAPTKPMDPKRLDAFRKLAEVGATLDELRAHRCPGQVSVSTFRNGKRVECVARDVGCDKMAEVLAFDGHDLAEVLRDRDHHYARAEKAEARLKIAGHILDLAARLKRAEAEVARLREQHIQTSAACESYADEAKRYRARCPVTAEDVERLGVSAGQALAWRDSDRSLGSAYVCEASPRGVASYIRTQIAAGHSACAMDILDEMAAIEVEQ